MKNYTQRVIWWMEANIVKTILLAACVAIVGIALLGCQPKDQTVNTAALQQKVLAAEVAWEAPLSIAIAYNNLVRCTAPKTVTVCSDQRAVNELRKLNHAVQEAFVTAMALASTPGVTEDRITATLAIAQTGVPGVQAIIAAYR